MDMRGPCILLAAGLIFIFPGFAAMAEGECADHSTQSGMNTCAASELKKADEELNAIYGKLLSRLDSGQKPLLKAAERAWIHYRDRMCEFQGSGTKGGSINPMIVANCLTELTTGQTRRLSQYLDCEEGDLSCP